MKRSFLTASFLMMCSLQTLTAAIVMGTGTEWGHWSGELSINGTYTTRKLYTILKDANVPSKLEKTWINTAVDVSHFQELLNNGVSPVLLEGKYTELAYKAVYPTGNTWDQSHVWNSSVKAEFDKYLNTTFADWIAALKTLNYNGKNLYYVLDPEFTFVGDAKTSSGYRDAIIKQISMLRAANLPNVKIIRGFLVNPSDFASWLPTIKSYATLNSSLLPRVDYFGPAFHNQLHVNASVAANMISFLTTVKSYTGRSNFIPSSYIYWNTTYNGNDTTGQTTGSDTDAAAFWNHLASHRDALANNAGVVAWCLSATLEARGGSGLVEPQKRPSNFAGYVYPFGTNGTYNKGGTAFINWMRAEDAR